MKNKMMKFLVVGMLCIGITGCGKNATGEPSQTKESTSATTSTQMQTSTESSKTTTSEEVREQQSSTQNSDTSQEAEDYYNIATNLSKNEVESFMEKVKTAIVNQDMETLYPLISYPIKIKEIEYKDENSLKAANFKFDEAYIQKVAKADSKNMFCNYQGIMLGNGEVWISEVLNDDYTSQGLKITAFNE